MAREWCRAPRLLFIFASFSFFIFFTLSLQDGLPPQICARSHISPMCAVSPSNHNILYRVWYIDGDCSQIGSRAAFIFFVLSISNFFLLVWGKHTTSSLVLPLGAEFSTRTPEDTYTADRSKYYITYRDMLLLCIPSPITWHTCLYIIVNKSCRDVGPTCRKATDH